jgi:hypothetical protein
MRFLAPSFLISALLAASTISASAKEHRRRRDQTIFSPPNSEPHQPQRQTHEILAPLVFPSPEITYEIVPHRFVVVLKESSHESFYTSHESWVLSSVLGIDKPDVHKPPILFLSSSLYLFSLNFLCSLSLTYEYKS